MTSWYFSHAMDLVLQMSVPQVYFRRIRHHHFKAWRLQYSHAIRRTSSYPLPQNSSPMHFSNVIKSHALWGKCEFVFRLVIVWMQSHTFLQIFHIRNIHIFSWPYQKTSFCFHDGKRHSSLKLLLRDITDVHVFLYIHFKKWKYHV